MADKRLDEINLSSSIDLLNSFIVGTKYTGAATPAGFEDFRWSLATLFGKIKTIVCVFSADGTEIVNTDLIDAVSVKVFSLGSGLMIDSNLTSFDESGASISNPNTSGSAYSFDSSLGKISFNSSRIITEVFIIQYIQR